MANDGEWWWWKTSTNTHASANTGVVSSRTRRSPLQFNWTPWRLVGDGGEVPWRSIGAGRRSGGSINGPGNSGGAAALHWAEWGVDTESASKLRINAPESRAILMGRRNHFVVAAAQDQNFGLLGQGVDGVGGAELDGVLPNCDGASKSSMSASSRHDVEKPVVEGVGPYFGSCCAFDKELKSGALDACCVNVAKKFNDAWGQDRLGQTYMRRSDLEAVEWPGSGERKMCRRNEALQDISTRTSAHKCQVKAYRDNHS
ncbi:hypothetical protein C8R47DRAFT_1080174 [Mycena vitilis]|nr:hypothetical protein C8R47DRAFT_1080174 [Mycena vitilis]